MALEPIIDLLQGSELGGAWGIIADLFITVFQLSQWVIKTITVVGAFRRETLAREIHV